MAHDREFQRKRKDTRMPVRDSHGEDQPAARQTEQDFDCAGHGIPLLLSPARHTGRTSLYRRNFPSYHRKHRRPCWNRAMLMQPLGMFFRIALRYRMLPEQSPRHRTTDEAISGRRFPGVLL